MLDTGKLRCWGSGTYGQLGYKNTNDIGDNETPASAGDVKMLQPGDTVIKVVSPHPYLRIARGQSCALLGQWELWAARVRQHEFDRDRTSPRRS
ncbi:MAG: hypothetical protein IPJ59_00140 [Nannocystis sp.]|nr:hypothetical protein [Nannocystis sp.]